jgi:heme exporter protein B
MRQGLTASLLMAVVTVVALGFAGLGTSLSEGLQAGLFWIALLFGLFSALARGFIVEEETGTADLLRVGATPTCVYWGKWLFHLSLYSLLSVVVVPLFHLFLKPPVGNVWGLFSMWLLGGLSLVTAMSFCGALVARTTVRGALLAALTFPILLPMVLMAIAGTKQALLGQSVQDALQGLFGYGLTLSAGASWVFEKIWKE